MRLRPHLSRRAPSRLPLRNGGSESWTYTSLGQKETHVDAEGHTTTWTYYPANAPADNPEGQVATITDRRSRVTEFEYFERGTLKTKTFPDNSTLDYTYDDYGNKLTETADNGDSQIWTYQNFRLVKTHTDGLGQVTSYNYGLNGTPCGCGGGGGPTLITRDDGTQIRQSYDPQGRLLERIVGFGLPEALTTSRAYDSAGRLDTVTDENGVVTKHSYDTRNRLLTVTRDFGGLNLATTHSYDVYGNLLTRQLPSAGLSTTRTTTMTYDVMNRVETVTDPAGAVTKNFYDLGGRRTDITAGFGTAKAQTTTLTFDDEDRVLITTYEDDSFTSTTYHPDGSLHARTDEEGNTWTYDNAIVTWTDSASDTYQAFRQSMQDPLLKTSYTYQKPMAWTSGLTRQESAESRVTENLFDAAGNLTATHRAPGTTDASLTIYGYDSLNRRNATIVDPLDDPTIPDPSKLNELTELDYDAIGRVTLLTDALGQETEYIYLNAVSADPVYPATRSQVTTILDDDRELVSRQDSLGRSIAETDAESQTVQKSYWFETALVDILTDAKDQETDFDYGVRGSIFRKTFEDSTYHQYGFDVLGRMKTHRTPKGEICTITYDDRNRVEKRDWSTATSDTDYQYFDNGLVKQIDNGVSKSDYTYNVRNQLKTEIQTLAGGVARTLTYDYDDDGLRTDLIYPSTRLVETAWTARGQLDTVDLEGPPPIANYGYDAAGRVTTIAHENGITEVKDHDAIGQLLSVSHENSTAPLSGHVYTYDNTGRRESEDGGTATLAIDKSFGYDDANQVTSATYGGGASDSYHYDLAGNRETASVATLGWASLTYTQNNVNQYTSITGQSAPLYDNNGNLTFSKGLTYTWDSENRLMSVVPTSPQVGDKALHYQYDGQHRRVTRTVREFHAALWSDLESTRFIYDGWNVIEEYNNPGASETLARIRVWGTDLSSSWQGAGGVGGLLATEEIGTGTTSTLYHFHYDGNGNVTEITDGTGAIAASYRYDAFGNLRNTPTGYGAENRYRFSTKPLDHEISTAPLYYYGYRYYDPVTGRWPSRDPIEEGGGVNLYGFGPNNPISGFDLLGGRWEETDDPNYTPDRWQRGQDAARSRARQLDPYDGMTEEEVACAKSRAALKSLVDAMIANGSGKAPDCSGEKGCELVTVIIELPDPCPPSFGQGALGHASLAIGDSIYDFPKINSGTSLSDFKERANKSRGDTILAFEFCACPPFTDNAEDYFKKLGKAEDDGSMIFSTPRDTLCPNRNESHCAASVGFVLSGQKDFFMSPKELALRLGGVWDLDGKVPTSSCGKSKGEKANIRTLNGHSY